MLKCPNCGHEGEMVADYYESVNQSIAGTIDDYDYTGVTDTYDDGATQDECIRCPECHEEVAVFGRFLFIPSEKLEEVYAILANERT